MLVVRDGVCEAQGQMRDFRPLLESPESRRADPFGLILGVGSGDKPEQADPADRCTCPLRESTMRPALRKTSKTHQKRPEQRNDGELTQLDADVETQQGGCEPIHREVHLGQNAREPEAMNESEGESEQHTDEPGIAGPLEQTEMAGCEEGESKQGQGGQVAETEEGDCARHDEGSGCESRNEPMPQNLQESEILQNLITLFCNPVY